MARTQSAKDAAWEKGLEKSVVTKIENKLRAAPRKLGHVDEIKKANGRVIGYFENGWYVITLADLSAEAHYW